MNLLFFSLIITKSPTVHMNVRQSHFEILVDVIVENLFTPEIIDGINRGFISSVEYIFNLYEDKKLWFDQLLREKKRVFFIEYDMWNKIYKVTDTYGNIINFSSIKDAIVKISTQKRVIIERIENLNKNTDYYVGIRIVVKPVSIENLNEIIRCLRGEVRKITKKDGSGPLLHLFNWARNLIGLGDRVVIKKKQNI